MYYKKPNLLIKTVFC